MRLLFGEQPLAPHAIGVPADATEPTSVTFQLTAVPADTYLVRLRVDGTDSILVDRSNPVPVFDPSQQVVVP